MISALRMCAATALLCLLAAAPRSGDDSWSTVVSNDGSWRVQWRLLVDQKPAAVPLPRKRFTMELRLESLREPRLPVQAVQVDAQMPDHMHGMNVVPVTTLGEGGAVRSEGMLFHMTGRWEVDVDIDDGQTIERAQWDIGMH